MRSSSLTSRNNLSAARNIIEVKRHRKKTVSKNREDPKKLAQEKMIAKFRKLFKKTDVNPTPDFVKVQKKCRPLAETSCDEKSDDENHKKLGNDVQLECKVLDKCVRNNIEKSPSSVKDECEKNKKRIKKHKSSSNLESKNIKNEVKTLKSLSESRVNKKSKNFCDIKPIRKLKKQKSETDLETITESDTKIREVGVVSPIKLKERSKKNYSPKVNARNTKSQSKEKCTKIRKRIRCRVFSSDSENSQNSNENPRKKPKIEKKSKGATICNNRRTKNDLENRNSDTELTGIDSESKEINEKSGSDTDIINDIPIDNKSIGSISTIISSHNSEKNVDAHSVSTLNTAVTPDKLKFNESSLNYSYLFNSTCSTPVSSKSKKSKCSSTKLSESDQQIQAIERTLELLQRGEDNKSLSSSDESTLYYTAHADIADFSNNSVKSPKTNQKKVSDCNKKTDANKPKILSRIIFKKVRRPFKRNIKQRSRLNTIPKSKLAHKKYYMVKNSFDAVNCLKKFSLNSEQKAAVIDYCKSSNKNRISTHRKINKIIRRKHSSNKEALEEKSSKDTEKNNPVHEKNNLVNEKNDLVHEKNMPKDTCIRSECENALTIAVPKVGIPTLDKSLLSDDLKYTADSSLSLQGEKLIPVNQSLERHNKNIEINNPFDKEKNKHIHKANVYSKSDKNKNCKKALGDLNLQTKNYENKNKLFKAIAISHAQRKEKNSLDEREQNGENNLNTEDNPNAKIISDAKHLAENDGSLPNLDFKDCIHSSSLDITTKLLPENSSNEECDTVAITSSKSNLLQNFASCKNNNLVQRKKSTLNERKNSFEFKNVNCSEDDNKNRDNKITFAEDNKHLETKNNIMLEKQISKETKQNTVPIKLNLNFQPALISEVPKRRRNWKSKNVERVKPIENLYSDVQENIKLLKNVGLDKSESKIIDQTEDTSDKIIVKQKQFKAAEFARKEICKKGILNLIEEKLEKIPLKEKICNNSERYKTEISEKMSPRKSPSQISHRAIIKDSYFKIQQEMYIKNSVSTVLPSEKLSPKIAKEFSPEKNEITNKKLQVLKKSPHKNFPCLGIKETCLDNQQKLSTYKIPNSTDPTKTSSCKYLKECTSKIDQEANSFAKTTTLQDFTLKRSPVKTSFKSHFNVQNVSKAKNMAISLPKNPFHLSPQKYNHNIHENAIAREKVILKPTLKITKEKITESQKIDKHFVSNASLSETPTMKRDSKNMRKDNTKWVPPKRITKDDNFDKKIELFKNVDIEKEFEKLISNDYDDGFDFRASSKGKSKRTVEEIKPIIFGSMHETSTINFTTNENTEVDLNETKYDLNVTNTATRHLNSTQVIGSDSDVISIYASSLEGFSEEDSDDDQSPSARTINKYINENDSFMKTEPECIKENKSFSRINYVKKYNKYSFMDQTLLSPDPDDDSSPKRIDRNKYSLERPRNLIEKDLFNLNIDGSSTNNTSKAVNVSNNNNKNYAQRNYRPVTFNLSADENANHTHILENNIYNPRFPGHKNNNFISSKRSGPLWPEHDPEYIEQMRAAQEMPGSDLFEYKQPLNHKARHILPQNQLFMPIQFVSQQNLNSPQSPTTQNSQQLSVRTKPLLPFPSSVPENPNSTHMHLPFPQDQLVTSFVNIRKPPPKFSTSVPPPAIINSPSGRNINQPNSIWNNINTNSTKLERFPYYHPRPRIRPWMGGHRVRFHNNFDRPPQEQWRPNKPYNNPHFNGSNSDMQ